MQLNGSQILIECLLEQGVDTIFGYPGGAILNVYDELYRYQDKIRHVLTSHEQGASHAADGYARSTGKVGVCMATSGPGATNLVTGIATAYMDSVPMVAITCNVGLPLLGKDSFQEVDIAGITMPITKHSFIVKDINDLAKVVRRAFAIAQTGRPGPVLVDITKDVTAAVTEFTPQTPDLIQRQTDTICENCGRNMVIKYGPHGKFLACPGFPDCRNTKPYYEKIGVMCPKCGDDIVIKKTKKGRRYYGCINNPECDFMSWQKPSEKKCPKCGGAMVEKGNKIVCMDEQCGYVEAKEKK